MFTGWSDIMKTQFTTTKMDKLTYDENTTLGKVNSMLSQSYNKVSLSLELGISRPTLNTRLEQDNWKKSEIEMVNKVFKKMKDGTS